MSAIQTELDKATGVKQAAGETRAAYLDKVLLAVKDLSDKEWGALSDPAADWFNGAMDVKNANIKNPRGAQPIPDYPDYKETAAAAEPTRRRRSEEPDPPAPPAAADRELAVGDECTVTSKRGKQYRGTVVELDDKIIVLRAEDGGEDEIPRDGAEIFIEGDDEPGAAGDGPEDYEPAVGDEVDVVSGRGKALTGKITEINDDVIVLNDDTEVTRATMKSIVRKAGTAPAPAAAPAAPSRRRSADDAPSTAHAVTGAEGEKPKRSSNPRGVSIGKRIREIVAEDLAVSEEDVLKVLKKEGLEFRENSVSMIYRDVQQLVDLLKSNKKLK